MAAFDPSSTDFSLLHEKVIVLVGGATGIGASTVKLAISHGAHVIFGDVNSADGQSLVDSFPPGRVTFQQCDITKYGDIIRLFEKAWELYGRVDHAVCCAGIFERQDWFNQELTRENLAENGPGDSSVLDVNVLGTASFSRVAVVYLRDKEQPKGDKSLTLLSSVNAFRESPGLFMYQTSKHAIQGLLRSARRPLWERHQIRLNAICPGMTESPMTKGLVEKFQKGGLYWQTSDVVAKVILGVQCSQSMFGKAMYIEGGDAVEIEDSINGSQAVWLGEEAARKMRSNTEAVNRGALTSR